MRLWVPLLRGRLRLIGYRSVQDFQKNAQNPVVWEAPLFVNDAGFSRRSGISLAHTVIQSYA
jgi:hypothetical protein